MSNATAHFLRYWRLAWPHFFSCMEPPRTDPLSQPDHMTRAGWTQQRLLKFGKKTCLSGVCHTGTKSFLAGKASHVKPSQSGVCPEGRRTRVTQWLEAKDKAKQWLQEVQGNISHMMPEQKILYIKHQKDTPSLLHTKEDFPVIQPAVIIRVSVNLAEQSKTC